MIDDPRLMHNINLSEEFFKNNFYFKKDSYNLPEIAINRIFDYASRLLSNAPVKTQIDMWNVITGPHKEYVQALLDRNITEFNKITQNICETQLVIGFMNYSHHAQLNNDINLKYIEALHFADKLISLAEYLKISKVYNPEQGPTNIVFDGANDKNILETVLKHIFAHEDRVINPPSAGGGAYGYCMNDKIYCMKDLKSFYSALRINNICEKNKINNDNSGN